MEGSGEMAAGGHCLHLDHLGGVPSLDVSHGDDGHPVQAVVPDGGFFLDMFIGRFSDPGSLPLLPAAQGREKC